MPQVQVRAAVKAQKAEARKRVPPFAVLLI